MKLLLLVLFSFPLIVFAQKEEGINWVKELSWQQVKEKAKRDNKYIFLDCYTTWCAPCKAMDKYVYVNDTVGLFFNSKFISVRVQMDKSENDNAYTKSWYSDAAEIGKKYWVDGYPTFIFLSPEGEIVHKESAYRDVSGLIDLAKEAMLPGRTFDHKYFMYDSLVSIHNAGKKEYQHYPFMITMAAKANNGDLCGVLIKELSDYLSSQKKYKRYTKDRLVMWTGLDLTFSSSSRVFHFFYKDHKLIDKIMAIKGFAASFIDKTIQAEIAGPFLDSQLKGAEKDITGGYTDISGKHLLQPNLREADWDKLFRQLRQKYPNSIANRNLLKAKVEWYRMHRNYEAFANTKLELLEKYPAGDLTNWPSAYKFNEFAWDVFVNITDRTIIRRTVKSMDELFRQNVGKSQLNLTLMYDTYANLLYKLGEKEEAIVWEQKAIDAAIDGWARQKDGYIEVLKQMKKGERTYVENGGGAIW